MKRKKIKTILLIGLISYFTVLSVDLFARTPEDQKSAINQDIEILEGVLDQLIIHDSPYLFSGNQDVNGIYLDGFGIMFDFESSGLLSLSEMLNRTFESLPKIRIDSDEEDRIIISVDDDKRKEEKTDQKAEIEKSLKKTENLIVEFFRDYASTIKSLPEDERICINIRNSSGFLIGESDDFKVPTQLRACVKASDLKDYRQGKIDEKKMTSLIKINRLYDNESRRDLDIFGGIIDRSVGRDSDNRIFHWDGKTRSMYLDGFGVIFFSPVAGFENIHRVLIKKADEIEKKVAKYEARVRKHEERVREYEEKAREYEQQLRDRKKDDEELEAPPAPPTLRRTATTPTHIVINTNGDTVNVDGDFDFDFDFDFDRESSMSQKEIDSLLNDLTDKITDALGKYGATLRSVKDNESILVAVDLSSHIWDSDYDMLYLKVKKSDITRYSRDKISYDKFRKTVEVWKD